MAFETPKVTRAGLKNGFLLQFFQIPTALCPRAKRFSVASQAASEPFRSVSLRRKYLEKFRCETIFETGSKSCGGFSLILLAVGLVLMLSMISISLNLSSSLRMKQSIGKLNKLEGFPSSETMAWHSYYRTLAHLSPVTSDAKGRSPAFLDSKYDEGLILAPDTYSPESYTLGDSLNLSTTLAVDSSSTILRRYSGTNLTYSDSKGGALPSCGHMEFTESKLVRACLVPLAGSGGSGPVGGGSTKLCGGKVEISFSKRAYCQDLVAKPLGYSKPVTLISTFQDMQKLVGVPGNYQLANDIECNGTCFSTRGMLNDSVLNGNGYTIKGTNEPLFIEVNRSWIINLSFEEVKIDRACLAEIGMGAISAIGEDDICVDGVVIKRAFLSSHDCSIGSVFGGLVSSGVGPTVLMNIASEGEIKLSGTLSTSGGIVGAADSTLAEKLVYIENVFFCGKLMSLSIGGAGGVVGSLGPFVSIVHATTFGGKIEAFQNVGGLAGKLTGGSKILRSQSRIDVISDRTKTESGIVGGLVGAMEEGEIIDSYALGNVEGVKQVGGLVGKMSDKSIIKNSYSIGKVTAGFVPGPLFPMGPPALPGDSGGLSSGVTGSFTTQSSYWDLDKSTQKTSGAGEGKNSSELETLSTYLGWDFENVWNPPKGSPPTLRWEK